LAGAPPGLASPADDNPTTTGARIALEIAIHSFSRLNIERPSTHNVKCIAVLGKSQGRPWQQALRNVVRVSLSTNVTIVPLDAADLSTNPPSGTRFKPDVVLGVGGYAPGPMVLAAALLGYPTAIQEQNSLPGIANGSA